MNTHTCSKTSFYKSITYVLTNYIYEDKLLLVNRDAKITCCL